MRSGRRDFGTCAGAASSCSSNQAVNPSGAHTQLGFDVADVEATVAQLRDNGVEFEEYDEPGLKTENGIAVIEGEKAAWFKDSEGNLLAVGEGN